MRLEIRRRGVEVTARLREYIVERLRLTLGRFTRAIGAIRVYLRAGNGARPADKLCRMVVELPRHGRVVVSGVDGAAPAAVTRAAIRAASSVQRRLNRKLAWRRRRRGESRRDRTRLWNRVRPLESRTP